MSDNKRVATKDDDLYHFIAYVSQSRDSPRFSRDVDLRHSTARVASARVPPAP